MNENIGIDNRTVRWRYGSRWKNALSNEYRNNNGRNSQFTRFSFIDFIDEDIFQVNGKSSYGKSSGYQLSFSAARNATTKATECVTFGFWFSYVGFLSLSNTDVLATF